MVQKSTINKLTVVKHLGGIAEESLSAIKVVSSFNREDRELKKFTKWSKRTQQVALTYTYTYSFMVGIMKFSIFFFYAYSLFIGSYFIEWGKYNAQTGAAYDQKDVISTVIALITGFVGLIGALPNI